ncbi:MAG: hypothetical protein WC426_07095 [Sulfuriferula sp.]
MIAVIVSAIVFMVLALVTLWLFSPKFRYWAERPKYTMLKRDEMFERASHDELNDHTGKHH